MFLSMSFCRPFAATILFNLFPATTKKNNNVQKVVCFAHFAWAHFWHFFHSFEKQNSLVDFFRCTIERKNKIYCVSIAFLVVFFSLSKQELLLARKNLARHLDLPLGFCHPTEKLQMWRESKTIDYINDESKFIYIEEFIVKHYRIYFSWTKEHWQTLSQWNHHN